jgi:hypothetical protein
MRVQHLGTQMGTPRWAGDYLDRSSLLPGGARLDPTQFGAADAVTVQLSAAADEGVTSLAIDAATGPIPEGAFVRFGDLVVVTTAAILAGAVALPVLATPRALLDNAQGFYAGSGLRTVPSGTPVGRTFAERTAGTAFGPLAATDDEVFLVAFDITDVSANPNVELYQPGKRVKENFLPGWGTMAANIKALIRARYTTTLGAD